MTPTSLSAPLIATNSLPGLGAVMSSTSSMFSSDEESCVCAKVCATTAQATASSTASLWLAILDMRDAAIFKTLQPLSLFTCEQKIGRYIIRIDRYI